MIKDLKVVYKWLHICNLTFGCCLLIAISILHIIEYVTRNPPSVFSLHWAAFGVSMCTIAGGTLFVMIAQLKSSAFDWFICDYISCGLNVYALIIHVIYQAFVLWFIPISKLLAIGLCTLIEALHTILLYNYSNRRCYIDIYAARLAFASSLLVDQIIQFHEYKFFVAYQMRDPLAILIDVSITYTLLIVGASIALVSWTMPTMGVIVLLSWVFSVEREILLMSICVELVAVAFVAVILVVISMHKKIVCRCHGNQR